MVLILGALKPCLVERIKTAEMAKVNLLASTYMLDDIPRLKDGAVSACP